MPGSSNWRLYVALNPMAAPQVVFRRARRLRVLPK